MEKGRKLRKRIQREKGRLKVGEVFTSARYVKMLRSIARQITDTGFDRVVVSKCHSGKAGTCDGDQIVIYINNAMTKSFPTAELKNRSIVGVLGHECGHQNYSSTDARKEYLEGMENGIWYPQPPKPENETESESLRQMMGYFQKKDRTALRFIATAASYIQNVLEDVYIEEKMCSRYPGSICTGIRQNRSRNLEQVPSLKAQMESGAGEVSAMVNLIAQYALSGGYNNWEEYQGDILDVLESVKPIIDGSVTGEQGSMRIIATNQILLKMWKLLKEQIEEIEEGQQGRDGSDDESESGSENGPEGGTQKEPENRPEDSQQKKAGEEPSSTLEKSMEQLRSEIPDFITETGGEGTPKGIPTDVEWTGRQEDISQTDEKPEHGQGACGSQSQEGTDTPEPYPIAKDGQTVDADAMLQAVVYEMAKGKALQGLYQDSMGKMKRELEDIEFREGHKEVRKVLLRSEHVTGKARLEYEAIKPQVKKVTQRMKASVLPILRMKEDRMEHKLLIGKKLDRRNIAERSGRIFQKKHLPGQNGETAVGVLIDMSQSMGGGRMESAKLAALCIYEFCRMAQIPISIYGHHTDRGVHLRLSDESVFLHSCAEFETDEDDRLRILQLEVDGSNRDGAALIYMGDKLLKRPEPQKILVLISDGLPNATYYRNEGAKQDLMKIKKSLRKRGITFLAAAIGDDREKIEEIYQEAFLDISDIGRMPAVLSKKLLSLIRRV